MGGSPPHLVVITSDSLRWAERGMLILIESWRSDLLNLTFCSPWRSWSSRWSRMGNRSICRSHLGHHNTTGIVSYYYTNIPTSPEPICNLKECAIGQKYWLTSLTRYSREINWTITSKQHHFSRFASEIPSSTRPSADLSSPVSPSMTVHFSIDEGIRVYKMTILEHACPYLSLDILIRVLIAQSS